MSKRTSARRSATDHPGARTGELLNTERRTVFHRGTEGSLNVNLTEFGVCLHDIDQGQMVNVQIHEHGIWIPLEGNE